MTSSMLPSDDDLGILVGTQFDHWSNRVSPVSKGIWP